MRVMINQVWIISEFHYDYYKFEDFVGVATSKQTALELIEDIYGSDIVTQIVDNELDHERLASDEKEHFYIFPQIIYEGVDK